MHTQRTTMERSLKLKRTETVFRRDVKCALAGWCGAIVSVQIAPHHLQTALFLLSSISFVERIRNTQNPNPSPKIIAEHRRNSLFSSAASVEVQLYASDTLSSYHSSKKKSFLTFAAVPWRRVREKIVYFRNKI